MGRRAVKQNVLQAWKLDMIRMFLRLGTAIEDADPSQRTDIELMRPMLERIKHLQPKAALNAQARAELLDTIDTIDQRINEIMGQHWQPHGDLANKVRAAGPQTAALLD